MDINSQELELLAGWYDKILAEEPSSLGGDDWRLRERLKLEQDKYAEIKKQETLPPSDDFGDRDLKIVKQVLEVIVDQLGLEDEPGINDNTRNNLGADSLDDVELVMAIEEEFGFSIPNETAEELRTVRDFVDIVIQNEARYE